MRLIEAIMDVVFIVFAVYGTFVLYKWKKCAEQVEKLIELLKDEKCPYNSGLFTDDDVADYLLANGVIVLPCKVGDTVYLINDGKIYEATVYRIEYIDHDQFGIATTVSARTQPSYSFGIRFDDFGKTVFFTREEAEAALKA